MSKRSIYRGEKCFIASPACEIPRTCFFRLIQLYRRYTEVETCKKETTSDHETRAESSAYTVHD